MISLALTRKFLWTKKCRRYPQAVSLVGLFVSLSSPSPGTRPLEVADLSQAQPPPTQVEIFHFFFQTLIKAPAGQQWIHCLWKSKIQAVSQQTLAASQGPAAHPSWMGCTGGTSTYSIAPVPVAAHVLLQLGSFAESVVMRDTLGGRVQAP